MSRKEASRADRDHRRWARRGRDAPDSGPSITRIIITAALALFVSAVFFVQLVSPSGLLAGMTGAEVAALSVEARTDRAGSPASPPTWTTLFARLRGELSGDPLTASRAAVDRLLFLVAECSRGKTDASKAAASPRTALLQDPDNLVSRLAAAVIVNWSARGADGAPREPAERFGELRQIVEGQAPVRATALYNREATAAWFEILGGELSRADVAASVARYVEHYETAAHFAGLAVIQHEVVDLAGALERTGKVDDADQCRRWLTTMYVGLMKREPDAGTRLLCADMLARTIDKSHADAAAALRRLRADYHTACAEAPIDLVDPARTPAVLGSRLRTSLALFVFACAAAFAALGGLPVLLLSPLARKKLSPHRPNQSPDHSNQSPDRKGGVGQQSEGPSVSRANRSLTVAALKDTVAARNYRTAALPFGVPVICCAAIAWRIAESGVHSAMWAVLSAVFLGTLGALVPMWSAGAGARRGAGVTAATTVVVFIVAAMIASPSHVARIARVIDMGVPVVWVAVAACGGAILFTSITSRATPRARLASAATTSLLCIVLAFAALQVHRAVDAKYLAEVATRRLDEVAARLGDDWQDRYLAPACRAYDIPLP